IGTEAEALEMRSVAGVKRATTRLCAETFKTLEARLPLGVNLAAIEGLTLVGVADNLVGGIELRETRGRLRIGLVRVGVQPFCEAPIGTFDIGLARTLGNPQNLVGVAHRIQTPVNPPGRQPDPQCGGPARPMQTVTRRPFPAQAQSASA